MATSAEFGFFLYAFLAVLHLALIATLFIRGNWRHCPNFSAYVVLNLLQGAMLLFIYNSYGIRSSLAQHLAWTTQAGVLCARALAISEICRRFLQKYRGIWALAWRLLATVFLLLAFGAILSAKWTWERAISHADLGLEFTIVATLAALFVFARYYDVVAPSNLRVLALGFFLLSCINVLNNAVLTRFATAYDGIWNLLSALSFSAVLMAWIWAMRKPIPTEAPEATLTSSAVYQSLSPEINLRLRALNKSLRTFFDREAHEL